MKTVFHLLYAKRFYCHHILRFFVFCFVAISLSSCVSTNEPYKSPWAGRHPIDNEQVTVEQKPNLGWQTRAQAENMTKEQDIWHQKNAQDVPRTPTTEAGLYGTHIPMNTGNEGQQNSPSNREYSDMHTKIMSGNNVQQPNTRQSNSQRQNQKFRTIEKSYNKPVIATRPVTVALLLPLTGKHAELGEAMSNAAQLALFDIGGENFKLLPRDTAGNPNKAREAARQAIKDGADLILGPVFSESVKAVKPLARQARIPVIGFSTNWRLADRNTYIMGFLPFAQVSRVANYAQSQGLKSFSVLAPQTDYSDIVIRTLRYSLLENGLHILKTSRFSAMQADLGEVLRDFTSYDQRLAKLEKAKEMAEAQGDDGKYLLEELEDMVTMGELPYDALLLPMGGENLRTVSTLLSHYDVDPEKVQLIGTGLWDDKSLTHEPGLYGAWFAAPDPNLRREFDESYLDSYGESAPRLATLAYDATALAAVMARGQYDVNIRSPYTHGNLTNPRGFAGIDGIFRFRPDGLVERGLAVIEIQDNITYVIDPAPTAFPSYRR